MQPVFIVAQYKCGTSWLLSALAAHPDVVGLREIDIVRCVYRGRMGRVATAPRDHRLRGFFGTSAWCREDPLDALGRGQHPDPGPPDLQRPQGFADLSPRVALELYRAVREGDDPHQVTDAFVSATSKVADGQTTLVLKAADQIAMFDQLQAWRPDAPKVAITRDGRDAAISAMHYRRLMAKEDAPWYAGSAQYADLLKTWADRAAMLAARSRSGELMLLRYEDLTSDFTGTFGALLQRLGLNSEVELVQRINERTSFRARTGRDRGSEGTGVIRKGAIGEWRETLTDREKTDAWRVAGKGLALLGYTAEGPPDAMPLGLMPRSG